MRWRSGRDYVDVRWQVATSAGVNRSLTILWGGTDHGDGYPFSPEVLAHTFYPAPVAPETLAGDMHFNENYLWGAGDSSRYDIFSVALARGRARARPCAFEQSRFGDVPDVPRHRERPHQPTTSTGRGACTPRRRRRVGSRRAGRTCTIGSARRADRSSPAGRASPSMRPGATCGTRPTSSASSRRPLSGDGDIVARVDSLEAVHRWTKAGVMIRATTDPGSPHAFMLVSGGKGLAFQRRRTQGGLTVSTDGIPGAAPQWVWLSRRGNTVEAYAAADGQSWRFIGSDTIDLGATALAGLAVTSHDPRRSRRRCSPRCR